MILVVDDNPRVTEFLSEALSAEGYAVVQARDGVEAYEYLKRPDCKAVVLDVQMPRFNGVELLLTMRADGIDVPVIIMTGREDLEEAELLEFPGVVAFLRKPFDLEHLYDALQKLLPKKQPKP